MQSISVSTAPICPRTSCDPWGRNKQVIVKLDLDRVNQHQRLTPDQKKCFQSHITSLTKHKSGKSYTPDSPYHHILKTLHHLKKQTTCTVRKSVWTSISLPFDTCSQSFSCSLYSYLLSSTHRSTYQHWPLPKQHNHFFCHLRSFTNCLHSTRKTAQCDQR